MGIEFRFKQNSIPIPPVQSSLGLWPLGLNQILQDSLTDSGFQFLHALFFNHFIYHAAPLGPCQFGRRDQRRIVTANTMFGDNLPPITWLQILLWVWPGLPVGGSLNREDQRKRDQQELQTH